ncbi:MAG: 50S ribosomal protein L4 [Oscillospiraceae bacterium]|nr:50S ribosomal protein L4 [Oscillospiraceae bacterium]
MPKVNVYDMAGKIVGEIELSDFVFGIEPNADVMHASVINYLANQRQGTQSALTRTEVSGGGRKPWRQKGTGHARPGSTRAPHWRHGGVVFAPKPREYRYSLNKKTKKLAFRSALSDKVAQNNIVVLDALELEAIKTKSVVNMLAALNAENALIVTAEKNEKVVKSAANIPGVETSTVGTVNIFEVMKYEKLVIVKDAVAKLEEVYAQ